MAIPYTIAFLLVMCLFNYRLSSAADDSKANTDKTPQDLENLLNASEFDEFANIVHIPNTDLVDPSQQKSSLEELYFYNGLDFGDILLRPGQLANPSQHFDFNGNLKLTINKWKNGIVPYYISTAFNNSETDFILSEIKYCNQVLGPNVNIRPYKDGDTNYVMVFKGGCGCYSNLGEVGGPQVISLRPPCLIEGFVKHEFQHVLGFAHETNRIDRDDYLGLMPANIPQTMKSQYEKYTAENWINMDEFDYYSIMAYPVKVAGFNLTAFDVFENGIDQSRPGAEKFLSPTDIKRVKTVYS